MVWYNIWAEVIEYLYESVQILFSHFVGWLDDVVFLSLYANDIMHNYFLHPAGWR